MKASLAQTNQRGSSVALAKEEGWVGDATGLGYGKSIFFIANEMGVTYYIPSTPARPLHESTIVAGFFCTSPMGMNPGGGR